MSLTLEEIVLFALGGCQMLALLFTLLCLSLTLSRSLSRVSHVNAEVVECFDNCVWDLATNARHKGAAISVPRIARFYQYLIE